MFFENVIWIFFGIMKGFGSLVELSIIVGNFFEMRSERRKGKNVEGIIDR